MPRPREHVERRGLPDCVPVLLQIGAVARERRAVAGDVDERFGRHLYNGFEQRFAAALARRIDQNDVRFNSLRFQLRSCLGRVGTEKARVADTVARGVLFGVADSVGTISTPMTCFASRAIVRPIVPVPQ